MPQSGYPHNGTSWYSDETARPELAWPPTGKVFHLPPRRTMRTEYLRMDLELGTWDDQSLLSAQPDLPRHWTRPGLSSGWIHASPPACQLTLSSTYQVLVFPMISWFHRLHAQR